MSPGSSSVSPIKIQQLVAAGRDDDLFDREIRLGGGPAVGGEHPVEHGLSQRRIADRGAVLQRGPGEGRIGPDPLQRLPGRLDGQGLVVDETRRQRDDLRMGQRLGHQCWKSARHRPSVRVD